jgi:hypothetical protein
MLRCRQDRDCQGERDPEPLAEIDDHVLVVGMPFVPDVGPPRRAGGTVSVRRMFVFHCFAIQWQPAFAREPRSMLLEASNVYLLDCRATSAAVMPSSASP